MAALQPALSWGVFTMWGHMGQACCQYSEPLMHWRQGRMMSFIMHSGSTPQYASVKGQL